MDKPAHAPLPQHATTPDTPAPQGAWDCHFHMLGGQSDFPLWDGRVEDPAPGPDFQGWLDLYRQQSAALGFSKGVVVHSILYGTDNSITRDAIHALGPDYVGVGLLPDGASTDTIHSFASDGMRAVRLNYVHGGVLTWDGAKAMAPKLADAGLHIQMLCHADQHMDQIAADIRALPVPVVFDHCAWPSAGLAPDAPGIDTLCALLEEGRAYVKLSALYRLCDAPYTAADALVRRLLDANPHHCLWGSDWPFIMLNDATSPQPAELLNALTRVTTEEERTLIHITNPERLYQP